MSKQLLNILFLFFSLLSYRTNSQTKYALLIGVSNYPTNQSKNQLWGPLNADNDLRLLKKNLPKQGFLSDHIYTLENEKVTPIGVTNAVTELCQKLKLGDIVIFHFSGHGQQITDLDNAEFDGFDEAFVCYNAPSLYYPGYKGEDHLIDDEINVLILKIRKKIGPTGHLLLLIDSCHSGNMSRGNNGLNRRGSSNKIEIPQDLSEHLAIENVKKGNSDWIENETEDAELSSFCAISGCMSSELNYEITDKSNVGYGSLTYAFCEILKQPGIEKMNYQDVAIRIKQIIQNKNSLKDLSQHPTAEGDLKNSFLSGQAMGIKPYFEIETVENNVVSIGGGLLSNLNIGDSLVFKNNVNKIFGKGMISSIDASQCKVISSEISSKMKLPLSNYTAEVSSRNLSAEFLTLYIKGTKKQISSLRDSLSDLYGYTLVNDTLGAMLILEINKDKNISCFFKNQPDQYIRNIRNQPFNNLTAVKKEMEAYFLIKRFSELEIHENLPASISYKRFAPVVPKQDDYNNYKISDSKFTHELNWEQGIFGKMKTKDLIQFELKASKPTYYVILNIINGEIKPVNGTFNSKIINIDKTNIAWMGAEKGDLYKIIMSDKPFNLENAPAVILGKSNLTRGNQEVTDFLFPKTNMSRGTEQKFSISNFVVEID
jgi:hypothetical protein